MLDTSSMRLDLTLKPIGHLQTPYKQKFGTPRQNGLVPAARAQLILNKELVPPGSLDSLKDFSHLWLLFHFHKNTNETVSGKVKPPRLKGEKMGLFATRSPHRPNPVGMSLVKIESINEEELSLEVSGVDLIDGTPIFDIKPYIAGYDSIENSHDGWTQNMKDKIWDVQWSEQALKDAEELPLSEDDRLLIQQSFLRDVRNQQDTIEGDPTKTYKSLIGHWDVEVRYSDKCSIVSIHYCSKTL